MSQNESAEITQHKQRVSKIFDGAAPTYGQVGPPFFSHFGRRLVEIAQIPNGSKVLDVATGRGALLFPAAESVGADGKAIGIDFSEKMVQETRKELLRLKLSPNIELVQMDAEHLQFPDETFDFVLCGFAIFFFPQLYQALGEFRRVLKPGGFVCVSTFDKSFGDGWTWLYNIVDSFLPSEPEEKKDPESEAEPKPVFGTPDGLQEIMATASFENVKIFTEGGDFIYPTNDEFWASLWSHGFRRLLGMIEKETGSEGLQRFKGEVFTKLDSIMQNDGYHQQINVHVCLAPK